MNIAYIYIVELYWRKMNNEHSWLKILTHIFPLSLAAAFILFWWIVFVPWANRFFYAYKNTKYALIECIELFWYHALESHWIAYHIVSWIQLNGEWFFVFFFFILPLPVQHFVPQALWIETSIVNDWRQRNLRNVIFFGYLVNFSPIFHGNIHSDAEISFSLNREH